MKHAIKDIAKLLLHKYYFWLILFLISIIAILSILILRPELMSFNYWSEPQFNRSDTLRNILLIPLAGIGLYIASKRSIIAAGQLRATETGLDIDRFQKAVELLQENAIHSRVAGVISLHDIAMKSIEYRNATVQILITFLQSKSTDFDIERHFQITAKDAESAYREWFSQPSVKTDSIRAFEALVDLNFSPLDVNQAFASAYKGIYLHGAYLRKLPSCTFTRCDFSSCTIRCKEGTLFIACDLTNATVIFDNQENYSIFPSSNVSNMKLQVCDEVSPIINGWHWEGFPPRIASDWGFITFPADRRIIRFSRKRIFPTTKLMDFYSKQRFGVPDDDPFFILDSPSSDFEKQTIEPDS